MKRILITGGTVFVSRFIAEYYIAMGYEVYVLNRNHRPQPANANLIQADRHQLGSTLSKLHFDVVIDTAYTAQDINLLLDALGGCDQYLLISSSAVYPENAPQPFMEETPLGANQYWGTYGTNKIAAEQALQKRKPDAYILRPPYLYGPMNNIYREAFVFDCALQGHPFYIPQNDTMKLQFFHIHDLCRLIDIILQEKPTQHIFNVGNRETISLREWVTLCYHTVNKPVRFISVPDSIAQRNYFCFYNYEYYLDVSKQYKLMKQTKSLEDGLKESFDWYKQHPDAVSKKPYLDFIEQNLLS